MTNEQQQLLPESLRIAQNAIKTKEVQHIIRQLSKYNLGVCMPHMHPAPGYFSELPAGTISLERKATFISASDVDPVNMLPVSWHWKNGAVVTAGSCHVLRKKCD